MLSKKLSIIGILFALAIAGYFVYGVFATSNPHTWDSGLVGYWSFDGQYTTSTDGTKDVSGNGNYGQFVNGVKPVAGIVGQALLFDGDDDYVNMGNGASLSPTTAITVEAWIKVPSQANFRVVAVKASDANWNTGYGFFLHGDGMRFYINHYSQNVAIFTYTADDAWHHWVGTYDSALASNQINIYKDGVAGTPDTLTASISAASLNLQLGFQTGGAYLKGLIDEVRIYNRALSADEVKQHYDQTRRNFVIDPTQSYRTTINSSVPSDWWTNGLVGYWSFDGQYTTSTAGTRDVSGNGNWGTFSGVKPVAGISGQALSFDGVDDSISIASAASLNITDAITIEAWVKVNVEGSGYWGIVDKPSGLYSLRKSNNGYLWFRTTTSSGLVDVGFGDGADLTDGLWHHVVATYNGSTMQTYNNGIADKNAVQTGTINTANDVLEIGRYDKANIRAWNGLMDEVRIYNRALSADEVMMHYQQTRRNLRL